MMSHPASIWRGLRLRGWRYLRSGIPGESTAEQRRCFLALRLAMPLHFLSTFPYSILFLFYGSWYLASLVIPLCLAYAIGFALSKVGKWDAARYFVLIPISLSIGGFCLLLGEASRLENTLFYGLTAPFLFFPVKEIRKLSITISVPVFVWIFLHSWGYRHFTPYALSDLQIILFKSFIAPTTASLLLVPLFFLLRAQSASEKRLTEIAAKAQASSLAKSEFLAMVSHELRTPLNGLIGSLELQEIAPESERRELLTRARRSGELLRTVIGDILDFSRLEKGLVTLHPVPVRPEALLQNILAMLGPSAERKMLKLNLALPEQSIRVVMDAERFQQIAINLIGNAIKFTPSGTVDVRLSVVGDSTDSVRLRLEVEDTGIGIPPSRIGELFQPFVQAHRGLKNNAEGCGLGLSICRELARAMHGDIVVQSRVGIGSRFTVELDLPNAPAEPAPGETGFALLQNDLRLDLLRGCALVVDDVKTNRIVATRMIHSLGMETAEAADGQEALSMWSIHRYPLVLLDLQMPVMDGFEACRRIREIERTSDHRTIVVAITANVFDAERQKCREAGMDGFLAKPYLRQDLFEAVMPHIRSLRPELLSF